MRATRDAQLCGIVALLLSTEFANNQRPSAHAATSMMNGGSRKVTLGAQGGGSQLVVDGKANPEVIPDTLAYTHFLRATSIRRNPSPTDLRVQQLQIGRVGLSDKDRDLYVSTVQAMRERLANNASTDTELQVVNEAVHRLSGQLTPKGFQRLELHVRQHVKRHIKVYAAAR